MIGTLMLHDWSDGRNPLLEEVVVRRVMKRFADVQIVTIHGWLGITKRVLRRRLMPYGSNAHALAEERSDDSQKRVVGTLNQEV